MKKVTLTILLIATLILTCFAFTFCGKEYTVTWQNWDGTVLEVDNVKEETTPTYDGMTPTKEGDEQYAYEFSGWDKEISAATGDTVYVAQFNEILLSYPIVWQNWDGTILQQSNENYGVTPSYNGETPFRESTAEHTYTFSGWTPTVNTVTGNTTYVAQFTAEARKYTVTWQNWDGSVLKVDEFAYGEYPAYHGDTPTKEGDAENSYYFYCWSPSFDTVRENVTYTAEFRSYKNTYYVTWENWDGATLAQSEYEYGAIPEYPDYLEEPTRYSDEQYIYIFAGWSPTIDVVTGNITYVAQYSSELRKYKVTWENWDGTTLETDENVEYGTMPAYNGETPSREPFLGRIYIFSGWSPSVDVVTGNVTYRAQFTSETAKYTVTWQNWDGTILEVDENVLHGTKPTYDGVTPTKAADVEYTYTFAGWFPYVSSYTTSDVTYVAQFSREFRKYTVTWKNWDGTELELDENVEYGAMPTYNGETPTKEKDVQYTYNFSGWDKTVGSVSGDITYTAEYNSTINKYTIVWKNYDGTVLKTDSVEYGKKPVYNGDTPTKAGGDVQYGYSFNGWTPTVVNVSEDAEYLATFTKTINKYTVIWKNYDGTVLEIDSNVEYGSIPAYDGACPTKPYDSLNNYTFVRWTPNVVAVNGDAIYVAVFSATESNEFTIKYDANGGTGAPSSQTKNKGQTITLSSTAPTNGEDIFIGWYCAYDGNTYKSGNTFNVEANVTLYAVWGHDCSTCAGNGTTAIEIDCSACSGNGYTTTTYEYWSPCPSGCSSGRVYEWVNCYSCNAAGGLATAYCTACQGAGTIREFYTCLNCNGSGGWYKEGTKLVRCTTCNASGKVPSTKICSACNGDKVVADLYSFNTIKLQVQESTIESTTVMLNKAYKLTVPSREGYTFVGWFDALENGKQYTDRNGVSLKVWDEENDITLYAQWIENYTITYNLDGGIANNKVSYNIETSTFTLNNPTRTGYKFLGWSGTDIDELSMEVVISACSTGERIYTANWEIITYTISYDLNGGIGNDNPTQFTVKTNSITLTNPTKEHYDFVGWESNGTIYTVIDTSTAKNYELKAKWVLHEYSITYVLGDGTTENPDTYNIESEDIILSHPTKKGYTFLGWTSNEHTLPVLEITIPHGSIGDRKYTAHWQANTYTITLNANGGETQDEPLTVVYDEEYALPTPTRDGYTFDGWFSGDTMYNGGIWQTDENLNLVAKWKAKGYTVTYEDVKSSIEVTFDYNYSGATSTTKTFNYSGRLFRPQDPARRGYIFTGWYTDSSCAMRYDFTGTITEDMTLYAGWATPTTANANSSMWIYPWEYDSSDYCYSQSTAGTSASKMNYIYVVAQESGVHSIYWRNSSSSSNYGYYLQIYNATTNEIIRSRASTCSTSYESKSFICSAGDVIEISFYRYSTSYYSTAYFYFDEFGWPKEGTASVDLENGCIYKEGSTLIDSIRYDANYVLLTPKRKGYVFDGWYYGDAKIESGAWKIASNVVLVAKWEKVEYIITYNLDGGTNASKNPSYYTKNDEIILEPPTKTGYKFLGWTGSNGDIPQIDVSFSGKDLHEREYTANWELLVFTIDYVLDGGTNSSDNPMKITILDEFELKNPTKAGYTFEGWYKESNYQTKVTSIGSGNCDNVTLYAKWEAIFTYNTNGTITGLTAHGETLSHIVIPKTIDGYEIISIDNYAFQDCRNLTSVVIENGIESIGEYAFYNCSCLTEITLPYLGASEDATGYQAVLGYIFGYTTSSNSNKISDTTHQYFKGSTYYHYYIPASLQKVTITGESISDKAFFGCKGLVSVVVGDSVTSIGNYAFQGCSALTNLVIGDSVTNIGHYAFAYCAGLTSIAVPDSVQSIDSYAFDGCSGLTSITIPDGVTSISGGAFYDCSGLRTITIPDSITSIGNHAFKNCNRLTKVYYKGSESDWSSLSIGSNNVTLTDANRYYYSENAPITAGNYWHYDESGNIVVW